MLVTLLIEPSEMRRQSRTQVLRDAGYAVASAEGPGTIDAGLSPDVVVISADTDVATRDAVVGRVGPVPLVRDDGDVDALLSSLRQLAADARPLLTMGSATVDLRTRSVLRPTGTVQLSDKESALLAWMLSRQGAVVARSELLVNVWGYHPSSTSRTVDVTLGRLREKIEDNPKKPAHLLTIRGEGYRLVGAGIVAVQTGQPAADAPANLFGRDDDLRRIRALLAPGRMVTLLGPPGVGKTTLSRAVLTGVDGVFVELETATTQDGVRAAMCTALGLPVHDLSAGRVVAALTAASCQVVVLDNAEQVTEALVVVFNEWVDAGANVAWLVTTRLRLRVDSEHVVDVDALDSASATDVFLARARERRPGYAQSDADLEHIRGLVADLEHIPLAIELAAARTRLFSPLALRERIQKSLTVLRDDRRDRVARQQTLSAAVAWSWDLLTDAEKQAMMQLSVVVSGVEVADAEAMLDVGDEDPIQVLEALVDHSLAQLDADGRLTQLVSVREFSAQKLKESGQAGAAIARHAHVFRERSRDWATGRDGVNAWRVAEEVERDRGNLMRALPALGTASGVADVMTSLQLSWELSGVANGDLTIACKVLGRQDGPECVDAALYLCLALARSGRVAEADEWLERVADKGATPSHQMRLLYLRAQVAQRAGDMSGAEELYAQTCAVPADDPAVYSRALISRVVRLRATSRVDSALALANEGLSWSQQRGVPMAELSFRVLVASLYRLLRRHEASISACEAILAVHRARGAEEPIAQILGLIGMNLQESGRAGDALEVLNDAIERAQRLGLLRLHGRLLGVRSRAAWCVADFARALSDAEAAIALNLRCRDSESLVVNRVAKAAAQRELGLLDSALIELRDAERVAQSLGSVRGLAHAARERAITGLVVQDTSEVADAIAVGLTAGHKASDPVFHALSAVLAMVDGGAAHDSLSHASAALIVNDPDRSALGLVALVRAIADQRDGEQSDWRAAERALASGWEPSFTDAHAVVCLGGTPRFSLSRVFADLQTGTTDSP